MTTFSGRQKDLAAVLLMVLMVLAVYWPAIVPGRTFLPADLLLLTPPWREQAAGLAPGFQAVARPAWDPLFQFFPARQFLAQSLSHGSLPLWNPHAFSGTPFAADGQTAVFYPINWLFVVLPLSAAFGWVAFLHTLLAGIFFYLFGRRMGWSRAGSLAGASCWMFCGVMVAWQMWQVVDSVLCWLPLALYFAEGWRLTRRPQQIAGLGIALGMSLLAGHLQFAFYVWLTSAGFALYRTAAGNAAGRLQTAAGFFAAALLGAGVAAVQLLATSGFLHESLRSSAPYKDIAASALSLSQLPLLLLPDIFGGQRDWTQHPFLAGNYYETVVYCGAAALTFALFGLQLLKRGDVSRFWLGLAVFALLMACGSPLYALFYYGVPLYKSFHGLSRICVLLDFAVAALCAQGITRLGLTDTASRRNSARAAAAAALLLVLVSYRAAVTASAPEISRMLSHEWLQYGLLQTGVALLFTLAAGIVLIYLPPRMHVLAPIFVAADMLIFACGINVGAGAQLLYPAAPDLQYVSTQMAANPDQRVLCLGDGDLSHAQSRLVPNSAMALGWNDVSGSDPLILDSYDRFVAQYNVRQSGSDAPAGYGTIADAGGAALDLLDTAWIVSPRLLANPSYVLAEQGSVAVYHNAAARGAAWLTQSWMAVPDSTLAMQNLFSPDLPAALNGPVGFPSVPGRSGAGLPVQCRIPGPGTEEMTVDSTAPAVLVTSMVGAGGWRAAVDGKPAPMLLVDGLLMGLSLEPGRHIVVFRYLPRTVWLGLYVSLLSWMLIMAVLILPAGRMSLRDDRGVC